MGGDVAPRTRNGKPRAMMEGVGSARAYRERADEVRVEAEKMNNPEMKRTLLNIADSYERLADAIDARARAQRH